MNRKFLSNCLVVSSILIFSPKTIDSELFTSVFQMNNLVHVSSNITKEFEAYFEKNYLNNKNTKR